MGIEPGQPKPALGKAQFGIVAQGSKEFDGYLIRTLQGADDEIAIRDQWRDDRFDPGASLGGHSLSKTVQEPPQTSFKNAMESESDESEETESEDDDDEEDDTVVDVESRAGIAAANKTKQKGPSKADIDFSAFQEFLKFQQAKTNERTNKN